MSELKEMMPFALLLGLFLIASILLPLFGFLKETFWLIVLAVMVLAPISLLGYFVYKAYKGNENVGKIIAVVFFAAFLFPTFVHPEVLDTRVTKGDIDLLDSGISEQFETINQTLNNINQKELICEQPGQLDEKSLFIIFPILIMQIFCTVVLIFFFRNR